MAMYYRDGEEVSDSVGLLISILVRYPEICTINFNPKQQTLKFTFTLTKILSVEEFADFAHRFTSSLKVYNLLEGNHKYNINIKKVDLEHFTLIEINRDVVTLSKEEISLIIELIHHKFSDILVTENSESMLEEDLLIQEELIEHMLANMKTSSVQEKNLIAFRDEGKVLVFNK